MASTQPFLCPVCHEPFIAQSVGSLTLGLCDRCGGVWMTTIQLKQLANEGAAALDQVMALEATHPHENHPHDGLICPGCKIPLHQTKYAAAAGVWTSTCYNCGGLYIDEESLKNLDQQAHQGMATPAPLSPEVQAICSSLDQMTQVDQIRTQMLCNFLEYHGRYPNRRFW